MATTDPDREISAKLAAAHHALAALTTPIVVAADFSWEHHWSAIAATETEIALLHQQRADREPADTEAAACAAHYHRRATTSRKWAAQAAVQS
jgi:hypothetical protein